MPSCRSCGYARDGIFAPLDELVEVSRTARVVDFSPTQKDNKPISDANGDSVRLGCEHEVWRHINDGCRLGATRAFNNPQRMT